MTERIASHRIHHMSESSGGRRKSARALPLYVHITASVALGIYDPGQGLHMLIVSGVG